MHICFYECDVLKMKTLTVFYPAMCRSTGVCGSDVDQVLVDFSADVQWLKGRGVQIERFNLEQQPVSFVETFLEASGAQGFPLLLLYGEMVMAARYQNALNWLAGLVYRWKRWV